MKRTVVYLGALGAMLAAAAMIASAISDDPAPPGAVVLRAGDSSGHDAVWEKRHYYFKPTWGIRGSGQPEAGEMWFDKFPGESGRYHVSLGIIAEQDGSPHFAVYAGDRLLKEGRFPYPAGSRNCDGRGSAMELDLGEHALMKGERIRVWGKSVYECGEKGAYTLWHSLVFTPSAAAAAGSSSGAAAGPSS